MPNATLKRHKTSIAEYDALTEMGFFDGLSVELIEGDIVEKMPQSENHAVVVALVSKVLGRAFSPDFHVRNQSPLALEDSKPEPDVAVVEGTERDYLASHPTTAVLVVEVAQTTLETDREIKSSLYAKAGIAEYWIVNLVENQLEVRRQPVAMPSAVYGFGYSSILILQSGQTVSPLGASHAQIAIADLLP